MCLYADDLAPAMEQIGRRMAEGRASLLDKGLKVNAEMSKVMVGSSDGKIIVNSGKWPTVCIKWIHKRCSGVLGDLSLVADGFMCKR